MLLLLVVLLAAAASVPSFLPHSSPTVITFLARCCHLLRRLLPFSSFAAAISCAAVVTLGAPIARGTRYCDVPMLAAPPVRKPNEWMCARMIWTVDGRAPCRRSGPFLRRIGLRAGDQPAPRRAGNTAVVCGVKCELAQPPQWQPDVGYLVPNAELSPMCSSRYRPVRFDRTPAPPVAGPPCCAILSTGAGPARARGAMYQRLPEPRHLRRIRHAPALHRRRYAGLVSLRRLPVPVRRRQRA